MKRALSALFILAIVTAVAQASILYPPGGYSFDTAKDDIPPQLKNTKLGEAVYSKAPAGYYIVQFRGPVRESDKDEIKARGAVIIGYLHQYAFIVKISAKSAAGCKGLPAVEWLGSFLPAYKLSPSIGKVLFTDPDRLADGRLWLSCYLWPGESVENVQQQLAALGGVIGRVTKGLYENSVEVKIDPARLSDAALVPEVKYIEEQPEYKLANRESRWCIQSNAATDTSIWSKGINGEGQILTIMDSGLDYASCWFQDPSVTTPGTTHRKNIANYAATGGGGVLYGECASDHGTHVSGTAVGDPDYIGSTNADYDGVAHKAKCVLQDIQDNATFSCNKGAVQAPADAALPTSYSESKNNYGSYIHTNSWCGGHQSNYSAMDYNIDNFLWNNKDFLVLFAAGNAGSAYSTVGNPAGKNLVNVGATAHPNSGTSYDQDSIADFSGRGPAADGRSKPEVCGPGVTVASADNSTTETPTCLLATGWNGTSMATPAVAGATCLIRQYFKEGWWNAGVKDLSKGFTPSGALLKATLVASCDSMLRGRTARPGNDQGWGRVRLDNGLWFSGEARKSHWWDGTSSLKRTVDVTPTVTTGITVTYVDTVKSNSQPLFISLCWTDYPAVSGTTARAIVNDLDLEVVSPGGTTYLGNVFSGGASVTGGTRDSLNQIECVYVQSPAAGNWTIKIIGKNVPQGEAKAGQPFSISVGGDLGGYSRALAVEFSEMTATLENEGVVIRWTVQSENNSYNWAVERSENPDSLFQEIGNVPARGTSSSPMMYSFTDEEIEANKVYYYRLAEIDNNGVKTYYGPITILTEPSRTSWPIEENAAMLGRVYPNPVKTTGTVNVEYLVMTPSVIKIRMYNIQGQEVKRLDEGYKKTGFYTANGKINDLGAGVYFVHFIATAQNGEVTPVKRVKKVTVLK